MSRIVETHTSLKSHSFMNLEVWERMLFWRDICEQEEKKNEAWTSDTMILRKPAPTGPILPVMFAIPGLLCLFLLQ